ncbi:MAG: hypothetical protein FWB73_07640 [Treponema sp.]|nr:hypothetical protein [Treponema sp.]
MNDGSYQIIEIKGDNKLDDKTVQAKKEAVKSLATGSNMIYKMIAGSEANKPEIVRPDFQSNIVKFPGLAKQDTGYSSTSDGYGAGMAAEVSTP